MKAIVSTLFPLVFGLLSLCIAVATFYFLVRFLLRRWPI